MPEQEARRDADAWEDLIANYIRGRSSVRSGRWPARRSTLSPRESARREQNRITACLQRLGWKRLPKDGDGNVLGAAVKATDDDRSFGSRLFSQAAAFVGVFGVDGLPDDISAALLLGAVPLLPIGPEGKSSVSSVTLKSLAMLAFVSSGSRPVIRASSGHEEAHCALRLRKAFGLRFFPRFTYAGG